MVTPMQDTVQSNHNSSDHEVSLSDKIDYLREHLSLQYPGQPLSCIETHMSWIFLISDKVWKMKKPVRYSFLDFTSLQARELYCREEVRLNARLAPGVYLGVMALQMEHGRLALVLEQQRASAEKTLDWLVAMRRLPAQRMLDRLIMDSSMNSMSAADIEGLIKLLCQFYRSAKRANLTPDAYLARFAHQQTLAREILLKPPCHLPSAADVINGFDVVLRQGAELLRERVMKKQIRECHGDLRPEHICMLEPPATPLVIDCLEFSLSMRQLDPFDEIAFLAMECEMVATTKPPSNTISAQLIAGLMAALADPVPDALLHLYTAHRAILRARLAMTHLLDAEPRTPKKWPPLAQRYLDRARLATQSFNAAMRFRSP